MKRTFVLSLIVALFCSSFNSCNMESTSDYIISWGISQMSTQGNPDDVTADMNTLYQAYDSEFAKASFGTAADHTIIAKSLTDSQIEKVKNEAKQLADNAHANLSDFVPAAGTYTMRVQGVDASGAVTIVEHQYTSAK